LPTVETDPTARTLATAEVLLDRYGILTRGSVVAEEVEGGFSAMYRVLAAAEDTGAVRRGYFVEHLGAAQFASAGAVDRLRALSRPVGDDRAQRSPGGVLLPATDPANPYGGALPWPERAEGGHRPGRKAGALVALVEGELACYLERGGRTVLTFAPEGVDTGPDPAALATTASLLVDSVMRGSIEKFLVTTIDGAPALTSDHPLVEALLAAGFHRAPQGLRVRRA